MTNKQKLRLESLISSYSKTRVLLYNLKEETTTNLVRLCALTTTNEQMAYRANEKANFILQLQSIVNQIPHDPELINQKTKSK